DQANHAEARSREHEQVPGVPGSTWFDVLFTVHRHWHEFVSFCDPGINLLQLVLQKRKYFFVRLCDLTVLFPLDRVLMQEKRAVVMLDLLRGRPRIFEVILYEFKVNGRNDALAVRGGGFHGSGGWLSGETIVGF